MSGCTVFHSRTAADGGIMLWRTFSLGPLVLVEGTVKVVDNMSINADQLKPYMASVFLDGNGIFQQDIVSFQKGRMVLEGFEEN
ncbi:transposable element Tc1 transposase [Trichonephila clavipes]|nr:transposable element Tc1 transposase [Trichonephila clavipes]